MLLAGLPDEEFKSLYAHSKLEQLTSNTISSKSQLLEELKKIHEYAEDLQEGVMGFCCVAALVYNVNSSMIASVSISVPLHQWETKRESCIREVCQLAARLSLVN